MRRSTTLTLAYYSKYANLVCPCPVRLIWLVSSSEGIVSEDAKLSVERGLTDVGISVIGQKDCGWTGGSVWLVPTDGDVASWEPIARRS